MVEDPTGASFIELCLDPKMVELVNRQTSLACEECGKFFCTHGYVEGPSCCDYCGAPDEYFDKEELMCSLKKEIEDMSFRKKNTGEYCYYKIPKEESIALMVRIWMVLVGDQKEILNIIEDLK